MKDFKTFRNKLNAELRSAKLGYYQRLFSDIKKQQPDAAWKVLNRVLGRESKTEMPSKLTHNNREIVGQALVDHFNQAFLKHTLPDSNLQVIKPSNNCPAESFALHDISEAEVYRTFLGLRNSKALDIDNLQIKPIKYVIECIAPALTHIFNLAIQSGQIPDALKRSKVTVIYKGGNKNETTNYRPISVVPIFSKGLEKI